MILSISYHLWYLSYGTRPYDNCGSKEGVLVLMFSMTLIEYTF
jgi:hypothetical protein